MRDCDAAYYLVHSMITAGFDYAKHDRELAKTFVRSAEKAGIKRLIYLGGLGELGDDLSEHLASRREVENILSSGSVPLTSFRAAMIIGSGSASFEILRYLVERLPIMITPKWVQSECQPIGIDDTLHYLTTCLKVPETKGQILDIGGADVKTYAQIIQCIASAMQLKRRIILPIPLLTPRLSSTWIHLVTPVSYRLARPLADGLRNRVVCRNKQAQELMHHAPMTLTEAIEKSLKSEGDNLSSWSDAGVIPGDPNWAGGTLQTDERTCDIDASAEVVFETVSQLGGTNGYHCGKLLWSLRGWIDRLVGGPGMGRGRPESKTLARGNVIDFWRVARVKRPNLLRLVAEMRLPGNAILEFKITPIDSEHCQLEQVAQFKPRGLLGLAYWYTIIPFHAIVFGGMCRGLKRSAEKTAQHMKHPIMEVDACRP